MKKYLPAIIISAIVSAITTSFIVLWSVKAFRPEPTVLREPTTARHINFLPESSFPEQFFYTAAPTQFTDAASVATPAVVSINVTATLSGMYWSKSGSIDPVSSGSGVIISDDGYVVTNNHVVEGGGNIEVKLLDGHTYDAELIGVDESTDLALLKIELENAPFLPLASSDSLRVGEWVLAVGNPFSLSSTVTAGIISAKGRSIDILEGQYKIESFLQTDAVVNPGNSGGALVNTNGQLIGINTAIMTETGSYEGYSFAIPSSIVRKVVADLKEFGTVQRGFLGVSIESLTEETALEKGLETVKGVHLTEVNKGSAAELAGLRKGDIILSVNDVETPNVPVIQEQIARYRPADRLEIRYWRDGQTRTCYAQLRNASNGLGTDVPNSRELSRLGLEVRELSKKECDDLALDHGLLVISLRRGTKLARTNMDPDFIITTVNGKAVKTVAELMHAIENAKSKVTLGGKYEAYPGEFFYSFTK